MRDQPSGPVVTQIIVIAYLASVLYSVLSGDLMASPEAEGADRQPSVTLERAEDADRVAKVQAIDLASLG